MDGGAWWALVHGIAKSWTQLSEFTFTFHFHALEKEMATHSSVLALRIPGMGEPGGLQSMGSHRVGHDWSDFAASSLLITDYSKILTVFVLIIYTLSFVNTNHGLELSVFWYEFYLQICIFSKFYFYCCLALEFWNSVFFPRALFSIASSHPQEMVCMTVGIFMVAFPAAFFCLFCTAA